MEKRHYFGLTSIDFIDFSNPNFNLKYNKCQLTICVLTKLEEHKNESMETLI